MEVANLTVEARTAEGTKNVRALRNTGKIPMILYGGKKDPVNLQASYVDVKRHLEHELRVYKLDMGGTEQPGYLQNVQWDCLTDEPLHMDFRRIEMDQPLHLQIEMVLIGHPKGVTTGGRLVRDMKHLELACMPASVPNEIEIRVAHLDKLDKILAKELELPDGCSLNCPEDAVVLHIASDDAPAGADDDAAEE